MLTIISPILEVKIPNGFMPVNSNRIVYIEAERKCSIIYFNDQKDESLKSIETFHQLNWYLRYLHAPHFFRCHKSFLINCHFVNQYNRREITLHKKTRVPLARNTINPFRKNMQYLVRAQGVALIV